MTTWTCDKCGLTLKNVKPPVRHNCPGKPRSRGIIGASEPIYITTDRLIRDTLSLVPKLPPIDCVVGIARSGLIPASTLATHLGCDLWSLDHRTGELSELGHGIRHQPRGRERVLLVDDSVWSGMAIEAGKRRLIEAWGVTPTTLAVYARPQSRHLVDLSQHAVEPHLFEWNLCNAPYIQSVAFDLDGVMCRDLARDEDDDGERYLAAIESLTPTHRRPRKPVKIITARLERYREPTEAWLAKHGIVAEQLIMGPWATMQEREANDVWGWKAGEAKRLGVTIMVESSRVGAARIADAAGITAIATDDGSVHAPRRKAKESIDISACIHRGELIETITCRGCGGAKQVDVYACGVHGRSHQVPANDHRAGMSCKGCALANEGFATFLEQGR